MSDDENITPEEDDAYILDVPNGYAVSYEGKHVSMRDSMDAAVGELVSIMQRDSFYPNVWFVNDHGNQTLLVITIDEHPSMSDFTWDYSDVSYV
jgi:hypothetical protein